MTAKNKYPAPVGMDTHTNREGRPFHLNRTERDSEGKWWATIRMEDTGEFIRMKWERIEEYYPSTPDKQ